MPGCRRRCASNVENALRLAVLRGITVFAASGDSGSYDCQRSKFSDHRLTVDFPSDSPQVVVGRRDAPLGADERRVRHRVGVGGPVLELGRGRRDQHVRRRSLVAGRRACRERTARGSRRRPRARARRAAGSPATTATGTRSAARARRRRSGRPRCCCRSSSRRSRASSGRASSHRSSTSSPRRISPTRRSTTWCTGANRHYDAGPGWDYATGLGSPDVYNLARDLVAYLRTNPCGPSS